MKPTPWITRIRFGLRIVARISLAITTLILFPPLASADRAQDLAKKASKVERATCERWTR